MLGMTPPDLVAIPPRPSSPDSPRRPRWTVPTLIVAGALAAVAMGLVVWDLWGSDRATARSQDQLLAQIQAGVYTAPPAVSPRGVDIVEQSTIALPPSDVPLSVPLGSPWAIIRIDDPDGNTMVGPTVVLQGVDDRLLARGPGHYPSTGEPGASGNVGIAGHRVTYGRPFHDLDLLEPGWVIVLVDRDGVEHEYQWHSTRIVAPDEVSVLGDDPTGSGLPTVTLTTCHPRYSNRERLVVHAVLV